MNYKKYKKIIAAGNINLDKIDEDKLVIGKDGSRWLNVSIFVNAEENRYGYDVDIQQTLSKEERMNGTKPTYLGNGITKYVE